MGALFEKHSLEMMETGWLESIVLFQHSLIPWLFKEGWTLKPLAANKIINLGTTHSLRIDLAKQFDICDVITLSTYLHCDVIKAPSVHI